MEQIRRDLYLNRLIERRENGMIKVVTGIRRCGKSYLLFKLYYQYLIESGVEASRIITIPLDDDDFDELHDSKKLSAYIKERITDDNMWYVFLDEVQLCGNFEAVLNGLNRRDNVDIYVTGSNSKFLSSDVLTEFRGRGDEVRVYPLSFSEYVSAYSGDKYDAWVDYYTYGGLPQILSRKTDELKSGYLTILCKELYLKDIENRHNLRGDNVMSALLDILASAVGSLTNPTKLANTFSSHGMPVSDKTIGTYIGYLLDTMPNRNRLYEEEPWYSRGLRFFPVDNYLVYLMVQRVIQNRIVLATYFWQWEYQKTKLKAQYELAGDIILQLMK